MRSHTWCAFFSREENPASPFHFRTPLRPSPTSFRTLGAISRSTQPHRAKLAVGGDAPASGLPLALSWTAGSCRPTACHTSIAVAAPTPNGSLLTGTAEGAPQVQALSFSSHLAHDVLRSGRSYRADQKNVLFIYMIPGKRNSNDAVQT
eukprot:gene17222-biopygen20356